MSRKHRLPPGEQYVLIKHFVLDCPAFKSLSGKAVKLLLLISRQFDGRNNGKISYGIRQAAKGIGCSANTAMEAFHELQEKGVHHLYRAGRLQPQNRACIDLAGEHSYDPRCQR
jgi:hypothetical protein